MRQIERQHETTARGRFFPGFLVTAIAVVGLVATGMIGLGTIGFAQNDGTDLELLEFKVGQPKTVTIYPGAGVDKKRGSFTKPGRVYWYLPYTLTNASTGTADFFVSVNASSDKGVRYSDLALGQVEKKVEQIEQRALLSKADVHRAGGKPSDYENFGAGEKKDCVAIFNPIDPEADTITVRVHGLINDIELEDLGGDRWKVTERVLEFVFKRPGDEFYTSLDRFKLVGKKWITQSREFDMAADE